jgi:hypothetical protein
MIVLGEAHLQRTLDAYANYYNRVGPTLQSTRMRRFAGQSGLLDLSTPSQFWADYTINMSGWNKWKRHQAIYVGVALVWLIPNRRIERVISSP